MNIDNLLERAYQHEHQAVPPDTGHVAVHGTGFFGRINKAVALKITVYFGSMWAFYILMAWQLGWIVWQASGILPIIKDPYPFSFLLFLGNLIQLWALPAIMVGQNVLAEQQNARAEADHATLTILHEINRQQLSILTKVDRLLLVGKEGTPPTEE